MVHVTTSIAAAFVVVVVVEAFGAVGVVGIDYLHYLVASLLQASKPRSLFCIQISTIRLQIKSFFSNEIKTDVKSNVLRPKI